MIIPKQQLNQPSILSVQIKSKLKKQIVKLAIFIIITVFMASFITSEKAISNYTFKVAQSRIINKHTRGVFPPLAGSYDNMMGKWQIDVVIGRENVDLDNFKNYTLEFYKGSQLKIKNKAAGCNFAKEYYMFNWKVFSFNLFISNGQLFKPEVVNEDKNTTQVPNENSENQITNTSQSTGVGNMISNLGKNQQDQNAQINQTATNLENQEEIQSQINTDQQIQTNQYQQQQQAQQNNPLLKTENPENQLKIFTQDCFNEDDLLLKHIGSFTIWTYIDQKLYILSQQMNQYEPELFIFVLSKKTLTNRILN